MLYEGLKEKNEKITGINEIKKIYFEQWYKKDSVSNLNYEEKLQLFLNEVLKKEINDCEVIAVEMPFEFIYQYGNEKQIIIHGYIDRVDRLPDSSLKVVDYKTSKKTYESSKLATPLQHVIYGLACFNEFGVLPSEYQYSFILLNEKQNACSKGYLKRGLAKLDKLLIQKEEMEKNNCFKPKATPLCYWCDFHGTSPNAADEFKGLCEYYSLWTPENKTFKTNKSGKTKIKVAEKKRRMIF